MTNKQIVNQTDPHHDYLIYMLDWLANKINQFRFDTDAAKDKPLIQRRYSVGAHKMFADFDAAVEYFDTRVLLVADKGFGKTLSLLNFTYQAILRRLNDQSQPLPIFAEIWRWDAQSATELDYYLAAQSPLEASAIRAEIEQGQALLILDGLGELGKKRQDQSTTEKTIFDPRLRFLDIVPDNCPLVLSSRPSDFQQLAEHIQLKGVVHLNSLSPSEIQHYLAISDSDKSTWQGIKQNMRLLAILRSPLLLSMFTFAIQHTPTALDAFKNLQSGELRDSIFEYFVASRYAYLVKNSNSTLPFTLQRIFAILGMAASRGVIRYGTGQVVFVEVNENEWEDFLAVKDLTFGFTNFDSPFGDDFMNLCHQLKLVICPENGIGSCTFIHPVVRDFLILKNCLPISEKIDSYTIESLSRISDERKYAAFAEILHGDFKLNQKIQAFAALENDPSDKATQTMIELSKTLEHEFFTEQIQESVRFRASLKQKDA